MIRKEVLEVKDLVKPCYEAIKVIAGKRKCPDCNGVGEIIPYMGECSTCNGTGKVKNLKKCSKCGLLKPQSEFYKHTRNPDGLRYHCKQCIAIERKETYLRYRESRLSYNKEWRKRNHKHCLVYNRQWRKNNPEKAKAMDMRNQMPNEEIRKYMRKTVLGIGGGKKIRRVIKRDYTNHCELCNTINKRLIYHHWDDADLQEGKRIKGIWICTYCHILVEAYEQEHLWRITKYLELKDKITEEIDKAVIELEKEVKNNGSNNALTQGG